MKRILIFGLALLALAFVSVSIVSAANRSSLTQVKAATAKYNSMQAAQADGYGLLPGLDHCFENPGVGAMGYHYISADLLNNIALDSNHPESLVYSRGDNGQLKLSAVEYIVPVKAWEDARMTGVPSVLGQDLHINPVLGVYVLHAWVWQDNPEGVYKDWNPEVSCP